VADNDPAVVKAVADADALAIPVIVLGEYRYGIAQSRHRAVYSNWLDLLIRDCRVLDVSELTSRHYAAVNLELRRIGKPIPTNDLWIAALCRQYKQVLLSRDRHFDLVPDIKRVEW
jgi:predicted nucleic acid-binding protein